MKRPQSHVRPAWLAAMLGLAFCAAPVARGQNLPDALAPATGFTPVLTVSDSVAETLKTTPAGPEITTKGTTKVSITANIAGIVLGDLDADTDFSISIGDLSVAGALGDAPGYAKGKTTAFIPFNTNDNGTPKGTNGVKLTWTAKRLTVAITRSLGDAADPGSVLAAQMAGLVDAKVRDTVEASVIFGPVSSAPRPVFIQGTATVRTQGDVELNSVTLTGAGDFLVPTVTITAPRNNVAAGPDVTVNGTAKDSINLARVEYAVNPEGSTWINVPFVLQNPQPPAAPGWGPASATWTFSLAGRPAGTTVVWVRTVDASGNVSKPAMVSFYQTIPAAALAGRWDAVLQPAQADGRRGVITFTTTSKGGLSGKLTLEGVAGATAFTGTLVGDRLQATIKVRGLPDISLNGQLSTLAPATPGEVTIAAELQVAGAGAPAAAFTAFRSHWTAKTPPPLLLTGRCHFGLADSDAAPVLGHGYFILTTAKAGTVTGTGKLADGTGVTWSGVLGSAGQVPVYVPLYGTRGCFYVQPVIAVDTGLPGAATATWRRPASFTDKQFPAGFDLELDMSGARYTSPAAKTRILGLTNAGPTAEAVWEGDGVTQPQTQSMTITEANKATFTSNLSSLKVNIAPATGLVTGDFKLPSNTVAKYDALIIGTTASGFYIAPPATGSPLKRFGTFELMPAQ